jgi:hypothetical protein
VLDRSSRRLQYLFGRLEAARTGAHTQSFEESDIKFGVHPTVKVTAGWRDTALSLQLAEMFRCAPETLGAFADMELYALHWRLA